jgi:hypothetical protein
MLTFTTHNCSSLSCAGYTNYYYISIHIHHLYVFLLSWRATLDEVPWWRTQTQPSFTGTQDSGGGASVGTLHTAMSDVGIVTPTI